MEWMIFCVSQWMHAPSFPDTRYECSNKNERKCDVFKYFVWIGFIRFKLFPINVYIYEFLTISPLEFAGLNTSQRRIGQVKNKRKWPGQGIFSQTCSRWVPTMYKPDSNTRKKFASIAHFINGIHYLYCFIVEGVYQSVWASLKFAAMAGMWSGGDQNTGDKERHTRYGMSWETASCKYNNWYTRIYVSPEQGV